MSEIASHPDETIRPASVRTLLKTQPHSIEAEQSVLGGLMLDNDAWFNVAEVISQRDFYRPQHRLIFESMTDLANDNDPLDAVTVSERLQSRGVLDKAGGLAYLGELAEGTPGASNVVAYAHIVGERSTLRQLIGAANRIAESAFAPEGKPSEELLDLAEQEVFRIADVLNSPVTTRVRVSCPQLSYSTTFRAIAPRRTFVRSCADSSPLMRAIPSISLGVIDVLLRKFPTLRDGLPGALHSSQF